MKRDIRLIGLQKAAEWQFAMVIDHTGAWPITVGPDDDLVGPAVSAQEDSERLRRMGRKMADHAGDGLPRLTDQATQQADDGVSQAGEHLGAMALSNLAAVLVERDIADPMEAVLDTPVPPVEGQ